MSFTPREVSRIKHFLKYPDWESMSNGVHLGFPAGAQPMYLVEQSIQRITLEGERTVRNDLDELEACECAIKDARRRYKAERLGDLKINENETQKLLDDLEFWRQTLSDDLGAPINPYTLENPSRSGMNARVIG